MRRKLPLLLPALLLVGCGKPDASPLAREKPGESPPPVEASRRQGTGPRTVEQGESDESLPELPQQEALVTALRLEPGPERESAVAEVAWNTIETDPETAHAAFRHLPADSAGKIRLIQHYAMMLAEESPEAAMEWAEARDSAQEIAAAKSHVALAIAEKDPARAATLLSESGLVGRELDAAVVQVVQRWAAKSPADAAAWVARFEPGPARQAGIQSVVERWLPQDAAAAFAWLGNLPDQRHRAETARAMQGVILQQPEATREAWLEKADPGIRRELEEQRGAAMKEMGDNIQPDAR
jgi:hypothetical protein